LQQFDIAAARALLDRQIRTIDPASIAQTRGQVFRVGICVGRENANTADPARILSEENRGSRKKSARKYADEPSSMVADSSPSFGTSSCLGARIIGYPTGAARQTIGKAQRRGDPMSPMHSAHALASVLDSDANACDEERFLRFSAINELNQRRAAQLDEFSFRDYDDRRCFVNCGVQMCA